MYRSNQHLWCAKTALKLKDQKTLSLQSTNYPMSVESLQKECYDLLEENYKMTYAIPRRQDRRRYVKQSKQVYDNHLREASDYFSLIAVKDDLMKIQRKMLLFWFYSGYINVDIETESQNSELITSKYPTKESVLQTFKDWPSGAAKFKSVASSYTEVMH